MDKKTLRDEFAMAALTGLLAADVNVEYKIKDAVEQAYEHADAMMEARGDE